MYGRAVFASVVAAVTVWAQPAPSTNLLSRFQVSLKQTLRRLPDYTCVETIVRSQVAGDWRGVLREVTTGRSKHRAHTGLRDLVAYVLTQRGYRTRDIAAVLRRDRSTISVQVAAFERRLASDELLSARVGKLLAAAGKERLSCAS